MSAEGFFHDAHEVYTNDNGNVLWLATLRSQGMADDYVAWLTPTFKLLFPSVTFEVRPV